MEEKAIKRISVVGLGWLGLPLAKSLENSGYKVCGSKTSLAGKANDTFEGVEAYHLESIPGVVCLNEKALFRSDLLVLCIPPDRKREDIEEFYPQQLDAISIMARRNGIKRCICISSTSVYGDEARRVDERSPLAPARASARAVAAGEESMRKFWGGDLTILRPGGLMGPGRHPGRFFGNRKDVPGGNKPVNLVHLDDIIGTVDFVLKQNLWGCIFNVVIPDHPARREFYPEAARLGGYGVPTFAMDEGEGKAVRSSLQEAGYHFTFKAALEAVKEIEG